MDIKATWQRLEIEGFEGIGAEEFSKTPLLVWKILSALCLPVRVFENNLWKPEKDGFLVKVTKKNGSVIVTINIKDPSRRGRKTHEIVLGNGSEISVGLPIL